MLLAPASLSVRVPRAMLRRRPEPAAIAAVLSLLVVTQLWVSGGGLGQAVAGGADTLSSIGRLTALLGSDLLLLQVLLMSRIPVVERAFGQDRLARWHRWAGFSSFALTMAHVVLATVAFAVADNRNIAAEFWHLTWTFPGMMLATAGTLVLILVVVTSIRAARRRLRYESWHLLHLYAYLGVGLALPHQLWTGADFLTSGWATAYWWTLWAVAAGAVIAYRIMQPAWRTWRHRLRVHAVVPEGPGLTSVILRGERLAELPVRAGQFFLWRFLDGPGWTRAHPFSLSARPDGTTLRITVKNLGDGSARIAGLRPGTRAIIEGPYGTLTADGYAGGPVTLIACGIGVTPLLALLADLPYGYGEATLLYRARSDEDVAFRAELDEYVARGGLRLIYLFGSRGPAGGWLPAQYPSPALTQLVPSVAESHVYICGPEEWAMSAESACRAAGTPGSRVHTELFTW